MKTIEEKLAEIKAALRPDLKLEGCTIEDLERIQTAQEVSCLPEMYRQLMLLVGKSGLYEILVSSDSIGNKFKWYATYAQEPLYPQDAFIFFQHDGYQYYMFRTKNCEEDPAVYAEWDGDWFYKYSDSLSEFVLKMLVSPFWKPDGKPYWDNTLKRVYYYDPEKDDFYDAPNPEPYD
jgi:hypothetical protein